MGAPPDPLLRLPLHINNTFGWNGLAFTQDNLWTDGTTQYAVFVHGTAKHAYIAKRTHGGTFGQPFNLSTVASSPLGVFSDDNHNDVIVAVDTAGHIHVVGNMHGSPLQYMRSTVAGDITSIAPASMTGSDESDVTYPTFIRLNNGELWFIFRDGSTAFGNCLINKYNPGTETWSRVCELFHGKTGPGENAYWHHVAVDRDSGAVHMMGTWRHDSGAESNADPWYVTCPDPESAPTVWEKSDGSAYTLPIEMVGSAEKVIDTDQYGSGLLNQGGMEVDADGHPHAAFTFRDGSDNLHIHHVWHDGSTWHNDQVTSWTAPCADLDVDPWPFSRPLVATFADGTVWIVAIVYAAGVSGWDTAVYRWDVTDPDNVTVETIYDREIYYWEPSMDTQALYLRDELWMLMPDREQNPSITALLGVVQVFTP